MLFGMAAQVYGVSEKVLSDSLTQVVRRHDGVGKVKVSNVRVSDTIVKVYTNATLGHISFTPEDVDYIRKMVGQVVLKKATINNIFICIFFDFSAFC